MNEKYTIIKNDLLEFDELFDVSQSLIGLTVVAIGTSLPELATSAVAAYKKQADIAIGKAAGCLAMGFGGRELAKRAAAMPQFISAVGSIFPKGLVPVPGGVLIRDASGLLLGAVGVSGDTSDNDEVCAIAGIAAAGLVADTGA